MVPLYLSFGTGGQIYLEIKSLRASQRPSGFHGDENDEYVLLGSFTSNPVLKEMPPEKIMPKFVLGAFPTVGSICWKRPFHNF